MKLHITLGGNAFIADDATDLTPALVGLFRTWLNAQSLEPAVTLEELTAALRSNTDRLHTAVESLAGHIGG